MNIPFSFRTLAIGLLLLALMVTGRLASYYHDNYKRALQQNAEQQKTLDQQSNIIATQAFQFQRTNEFSVAANRYGINTDAATQEKEIEYRTIFKNQQTCDLAVPAAIAGRLLDYTHRIRSRAMSGDTGNDDAAGVGPATSGTLTYCQAVLWIDPLLAAIDKANNQLLAIRQLDEERNR